MMQVGGWAGCLATVVVHQSVLAAEQAGQYHLSAG